MIGLSPLNEGRIRQAHQTGLTYLPSALHESVDVALAVEEHRWAWRPAEVRFVLVAESHVYTSESDLRYCVAGSGLPVGLPDRLVRLVYCLGYGEVGLLNPRPATGAYQRWGTPQYWKLFGCLARTGKVPSRGPARIGWKVQTLTALQARGIWLLDASVHALYAPGASASVSAADRRAIHVAWWSEYGRHVLRELDEVPVWVVGRGVHKVLCGVATGLQIIGCISQPQAHLTKAARAAEMRCLCSAVASAT